MWKFNKNWYRYINIHPGYIPVVVAFLLQTNSFLPSDWLGVPCLVDTCLVMRVDLCREKKYRNVYKDVIIKSMKGRPGKNRKIRKLHAGKLCDCDWKKIIIKKYIREICTTEGKLDQTGRKFLICLQGNKHFSRPDERLQTIQHGYF